MAGDPDADDTVTAAQDGVRVEKRFTADEFPVPAVKFVLRSEADAPVEVRLTDDIPESFDMEGIGFHPEYDADAWTAYRDNRVEYERTLDPDEEVTTVYGVRVDDPEAGDQFLGDPRLELLSSDDERPTPEDVLGRETTSQVRDALAGEGGSDADAEVDRDEPQAPAAVAAEPAGPAADAAADATEEGDPAAAETAESGDSPAVEESDEDAGASGPRSVDDALTSAVEAVDAEGTESAEPGSVDEGLTPAVDAASDATAAGSASEAGTEVPGATPGNVVAALAAEVREGEIDDDDLAVLRDALDPGVPRSVEVRIDRLQNRTEDLAAYADALEAFIDEEGTAQEVLDGLESETAALREDLDAVAEDVDEAAAERASLEAETADIADEVADHHDRLDDVEADVTDLDERIAALEDDLDGVRASIDDLAGDTDENLASVQDTLDDVEATVADLEDEIEDLHSFRDRMRDAFGS